MKENRIKKCKMYIFLTEIILTALILIAIYQFSIRRNFGIGLLLLIFVLLLGLSVMVIKKV